MSPSKINNQQKRTNVLKPSINRKIKDKGNSPLSSKPNVSALRQRYMGNHYIQALSEHNISRLLIQRKCACGGTCASCTAKEEQRIQAKLKVGASNDRYEQEADQVASQIMRIPEISRQSDGKEEEKLIQPKIQRVSSIGDVGFDPGPDFQLSRSGGQALSDTTRQFMEPRFGADFSAVRVHTGTQAEQSAAQINARAYTHNNHITLGKEASESDRSLMAHELTHVVQQTMVSNTEGVLQREEHEGKKEGVTGKFKRKRGFTFNPEKGITNSFGFNLDLKIPLIKSKMGPVAYFSQLEISAKGSTENANLPPGTTRIETLAPEVVLMLISLEIERLKRTRFGDFSAEAGMGLSANTSAKLRPGEPEGLEAEAGMEPEKPKGFEVGAGFEASANAEVGFQSRPLKFLPGNIRLTVGLEGEASTGLNLGERPELKFEGGPSVGAVSGQSFLQLKAIAEVGMRGNGSGFEVESPGVSFFGFVGFKF